MAKRKSISKKTRFEVFKRDSFTCQYCGRSAPEIVLHLEHIHPVSKGGDNTILNLLTSCQECNAGKSDRLLSDNSAVTKQKAQLDELNERREQLEMMIQWRSGLRELDDTALEAIQEEWLHTVNNTYSLNDGGIAEAKKLLTKYGLPAVLDAVSKASLYLKTDQDAGYTKDSVEIAWKKVGGICKIASMPEWLQRIYHIRNIARKRLPWGCSESSAAYLLQAFTKAYKAGVELDTLQAIAGVGHNYNQLQDAIWSAEVEAEGEVLP